MLLDGQEWQHLLGRGVLVVQLLWPVRVSRQQPMSQYKLVEVLKTGETLGFFSERSQSPHWLRIPVRGPEQSP
jgi:hypothetical protein